MICGDGEKGEERASEHQSPGSYSGQRGDQELEGVLLVFHPVLKHNNFNGSDTSAKRHSQPDSCSLFFSLWGEQ